MGSKNTSYGEAISEGFDYLLGSYPEAFVIGQGLWSPWYVGNSMKDLDKKFGFKRVLDTPVSENACTGAAVGAAISGLKPIVVHPRVDFMILAVDAMVNQAAKWGHMLGGQGGYPGVVFRGIINRGGEQGAQHSQSLHSWFAHIPGLRVVMPYSAKDARDLLVAASLCGDPVVYLDDRWLYDMEEELPPVEELDLRKEGPKVVKAGADLSIVASGYSVRLALMASEEMEKQGIHAEVIDVRVLNPYKGYVVHESVKKTGRLLVVDGSWANCGLSASVIADVCENIDIRLLKSSPQRLTLKEAPAPTAKNLEQMYYPQVADVVKMCDRLFQE